MNELEYRLCNISLPLRAGMADIITLFSLKENPDIEEDSEGDEESEDN